MKRENFTGETFDTVGMKVFGTVLFQLNGGDWKECNMKPKHPRLKSTIYKLVNKLSRNDAERKVTLNSSAISIAWEVMDSFELPEGTTWEAVLAGEDNKTLNMLVKCIATKLHHELPILANPDTRRMYDNETQGKKYVGIKFDSLDRPTFNDDGDQVGTIGEDVSQSYFSPKQHSYKGGNPFVDWFKENRHTILTKRQNDLYDCIGGVTLAKDSDYIIGNDFAKLARMQPKDLDRFIKRIRERVDKAWEEVKQNMPELSRRGVYLTEQLELWSDFLAIAEDDSDLDNMNVKLSDWIAGAPSDDKYDQEETAEDLRDTGNVDEVIYDWLAGDLEGTKSFVAFMKGETESIGAKTLYKVYGLAEKKVARIKEELDNLTCLTEFPSIPRRKEENEKRNAKYDAFVEDQPCKVYDKDGNFLRVEAVGRFRDYKVHGLNAFGVVGEDI
jgi:hypothetical protein